MDGTWWRVWPEWGIRTEREAERDAKSGLHWKRTTEGGSWGSLFGLLTLFSDNLVVLNPPPFGRLCLRIRLGQIISVSDCLFPFVSRCVGNVNGRQSRYRLILRNLPWIRWVINFPKALLPQIRLNLTSNRIRGNSSHANQQSSNQIISHFFLDFWDFFFFLIFFKNDLSRLSVGTRHLLTLLALGATPHIYIWKFDEFIHIFRVE